MTGAAVGLSCRAEPAGIAAALSLGTALTLLAWRERVAPAFAAAALVTFGTSGYAVGATAAYRATHSQLRVTLAHEVGPGAVSDGPGDPITLIGRILADAAPAESGTRLALDVEQVVLDGRAHDAQGGVLLTVAGNALAGTVEEWRRGRALRLPAQLRRPTRYLNPGGGDDEGALARRGTTLVGGVKSARLVEVVRRGRPDEEAAAAVRLRIRRLVERSVGAHSARSAAIVRAILLGDRAGLDEQTEQRLQEAGTYHVLAISGGNIALLAAGLLGLAALFGLSSGAAHLAVAAVLVGYAGLVGGGASVVRATQMAVVYLAARAIDHRARPFNSIGASAGLTCAVDPLVVCDAGAWLTYGATIAILAGTPRLLSRVRTASTALRAPASLLAASISAEVALFPVSALVFSRVTAAGLLLNFAAIPLMSVVQGGGMAVVAASVVLPGAVPPLAWVTHLAAWGLVESGGLVELMPWAVERVPAPRTGILVAYYAGWLAWLAARHLHASGRAGPHAGPWLRRVACLAVVVCGLWIILTPQLRFSRTDALEATFIDVGQGAATLVRFPSGHAMLVDAGGAGGGRFDVGRRVIEPAIWTAGVSRLSHFVATHPDADHIAGAASVIADFRPGEIWEGVPVPPDPLLRQLRDAAALAGASWRTVQRRDRIRFGEAEVITWHPQPPEWERQRVRNDDSVVVEVRFGRVSLLLAGDVEASGEAGVAALLEPAGVRVMLAPHHGSASSSSRALLESARPSLAVISAGRGNRYGHPHAAVLQRYGAIGARVLRTDLDGAITLRTDGVLVGVTTFTGRSLTLGAESAKPPVPPA